MSSSSLTGVKGGTESSSERAKDGVEPRKNGEAGRAGTSCSIGIVGWKTETLVPRADV
jgi:hypothetical protein